METIEHHLTTPLISSLSTHALDTIVIQLCTAVLFQQILVTVQSYLTLVGRCNCAVNTKQEG